MAPRPMLAFDLPAVAAPAECLAWDEAMLDAVEHGECGPALWFWQAPAPCVVVGYGQSPRREVHVEACKADGVPVLRRCSGGGTVVQGPGCLSYAVALPVHFHPALETIRGTNGLVMARQQAAIQSIVPGHVEILGHTDLVWNQRKVSGNAQRRKRQAVLFHGTFLHALDLALVPRWLPQPSSQPAYRDNRAHGDFIANLPCHPRAIREALTRQWHARDGPPPAAVLPRVQQLMAQRYSLPGWHDRRAED